MSSAAKVSIIIAVLSISQFVVAQPAFAQGRWGGRGGRDDNRPMSNDEIAQRVARTADFLKRADANGNGVIDPDEASDPQTKSMLDRIFGRMGKEPHFPMAISEILQGYEAYYRARGSNGSGSSSPGGAPQGGASPTTGWASPPGLGFGSPASPASGGSTASQPAISSASGTTGVTLSVVPSSAAATPSQVSAASPALSSSAALSPAASSPSPAASSPADAKLAPRKPGRFLTARERLPKGLPDWFLEKDMHGDGQITMAEFTDNWTPDKVAEFARYDLNHDGIITAAECLKVEKAKASGK